LPGRRPRLPCLVFPQRATFYAASNGKRHGSSSTCRAFRNGVSAHMTAASVDRLGVPPREPLIRQSNRRNPPPQSAQTSPYYPSTTVATQVAPRHPNDRAEVLRKLKGDARALSPRERRELRGLLDAALARLTRRNP
jgi:hypothetical protein